MSAPSPIRRSKELAPLSREHHEGLLFVFKIRQGLKLGISKERMGQFCTWSLDSHFDLHFKKEESELVPVLGTAHTLVLKMLEDHAVIRNLFDDVKNNRHMAALQNLAQNINDHIRFEERQLFPLIEQAASPEQLKAMEQSLAAKESIIKPWTDEFWIAPR